VVVETAEPAPAPEPAPETALPQAAANPWDGELSAGAEALESGDGLMAALHFAVALRMSPEAARAVIDGIGEHGDLALELVRGDALRLLGNESDAGQAYASVASKLGKAKSAAAPKLGKAKSAAAPKLGKAKSAAAPEPAPEAAAPEPAPEAAAPEPAPEAAAPEPAPEAAAPEPAPEPAPDAAVMPEADESPRVIRWE
jgi:hypothetical protein